MKPLRIVHTESSLGWGGQEIRILSESQGMIGRGHSVHLLCPQEARIHAEAERYGVPVTALPIGRKRIGGLSCLVEWFRSNRCDLVNSHSSTDSWLVALALMTLGRPFPVVRTRHISARVPGNFATRWLYARAASRIVTTGEAIKRHLVEAIGMPESMVESVPTGIDTALFSPGDRGAARSALGLAQDRTLVGIVATLRSWKGHRYLLEAMSHLPASVDLAIVGDGPQREALEKQSAASGLGERVRFAGDQADVVPWLRALDIFALPSYANEGVPQALVQAMLTGLSCITTTAGSIGELATHEATALVVPARDPAALAAAIERLAADPGLRAHLGAQARAHCEERFSRDRMLDRMQAVYAAVTAHR